MTRRKYIFGHSGTLPSPQKTIPNDGHRTYIFCQSVKFGDFSCFFHYMEKENICLSNLHEIYPTCHRLKSTATRRILLTFDYEKKPLSWSKKEKTHLVPATSKNSSF